MLIVFKLFLLAFVIAFLFWHFDKKILKKQSIEGLLTAKYVIKQSVPHINTNFSYVKEKEKYILIINEAKEEVSKKEFILSEVGTKIKVDKFYTHLRKRHIKTLIKRTN